MLRNLLNNGRPIAVRRYSRVSAVIFALSLALPLCADRVTAEGEATASARVQATAECFEVNTTSSNASDAVHQATIVVDVSVPNPARFSDFASKLIDVAKRRNGEMQKCQVAIEHFGSKKAYLKALANDALNSVLMYKGVSVASEAGDVILDEKLKIKGKGSILLLNQKLGDDLEVATLTNLLEIAAGAGCPDRVAGERQVKDAEDDLARLVGEQQSAKAVAWIRGLAPTSQLSNCVGLTVKQTRLRSQSAFKQAMQIDPIVEEVKSDVHKYNTHSGAVLAAHRIVRTTLSIVSLAPNFAGPAAQAALFGTVVLSGGSEESKILKELYMEKRLQSRVAALSEEVHLVFDNYKLGVLSKNMPLAVCSEELLARVTGAEQAKQLLQEANFGDTQVAVATTTGSEPAHASGEVIDSKLEHEPEVVITVGGGTTD